MLEEVNMDSKSLPTYPPSGTKRYRMHCRDPKENPFSPRGPTSLIKTADIDASVPLTQVEAWARDDAEKSRFTFRSLEVLS